MEADTKTAVEQVLMGDVDAYADVVRAHQQEIWRIVAYAMRDRTATEDLVQQVFVQAYLNLDRYDPARDFGTWIRTIARNLVRNELRRSSRETHWLRRYHEFVALRWENSDAAEQAEQSMRKDLEDCRKELSENASEALSMRYEQGMGFEQIAGILGRTVAATRQMLARIRIALRRCVEERRSHA
jgi:RNA polymerase sigma-70 factor (ECF subfamily)